MGIQWSTVVTKMMKSILFATLVAAASAGAEPKSKAEAQPFYGYPSMGFNFHGMHPHPYGNFHSMYKRSADADVDNYYGGYNYGYNFNGYPYFYGNFNGQYPHHFMGKRSADAEAFYSPYGYGSPYFGGYGSHSYNYSPYSYGYQSYNY